MELKEMIAVMQAADEGKAIQWRRRFGPGDDGWHDYTGGDSLWSWERYEYRVKPEPRRVWVNIYEEFNSNSHETREQADRNAGDTRIECVEFIEVLPE